MVVLVPGLSMGVAGLILPCVTPDLAELRDRVEKSKSCRPSTAKRLVAQWDESACTRASAASLVPFKRVLAMRTCTCVPSCSLDSGGPKRVVTKE